MKRIVGIVLGLGLVCAAHAAIVADDVIYVDFGHTPSSGNTNNISSSLGALSVADAIRLSDGAATGVGIAVAQSPASSTYTEANTIAGNALSTDATACGDALGRNNGGGSTLSITFTGLDTSLCYDLTGGVSVDNSIAYKYATGWTVDSIRLLSYATASTGYITFDGLTTSDGTLTITLDNNNVNHLAVSQLTLTARDHVTQEEMMENLDDILSAFPDYSWDKISRLGSGHKNAAWTGAEMDIICNNCQVVWLSEENNECERFLSRHPDNIYAFRAYMNLGKAYRHPEDKPEFFVYTSNGEPYYFSGGHEAYNLANPECREWWLDTLADLAYQSPKPDVMFIDALMKALLIQRLDLYDYWGNPISDGYMEGAAVPLLKSIRDRFSEDFILEGNFIRATSPFTPDGNLSYCTEYVHSSYLENFEVDGEDYAQYVHDTIEYVQQAVDQGKMINPHFNPDKPTVCADMTIEEKRAKASAAMPVFWERLDPAEQDELAEMYAYFDMKLAIFLIMAGEHSYLRYCDALSVESAGTDIFKLVPPFPEFDRKLGAPISDGVRISDTTWEREFEYCKVTLNVDEGIADIDWTHRADGQCENMAIGNPTEQSSTLEDYSADRACDGNTDGDLANGSVSHTLNSSQPWWEVDLEAIREIGFIDVWGRTDNRYWLLKDFYVLVSVDPFESTDLTTTLAQPGVTAVYVEGRIDSLPNCMISLQVDAPGRYVRVQLASDSTLLMLAEVQVWSPVGTPAVQISLSGGGLGAGGDLVFSWYTVDGQSYNVETNADLTVPSGWGVSETIVGDGNPVSFTNTPALDQLFYKVTSE